MNTLEKMVVLIDSDNTQLKKIELILQEVSTHGRIVVKRAYGNWKKESLKNWEDELKRLAIKAEQQFDYVAGKNATDMALVIDAIELLHSKNYDGFVIVASDSDYTPLAIKLHESGVYVIGVGEHKTPESFRNSCDEFLFIENLNLPELPQSGDSVAEPHSAVRTDPQGNAGDGSAAEATADDLKTVHSLLRRAWETYQDDDGYVNISAAGSYIKRAKPDFDVRSYGFEKLTQLIGKYPNMYDKKRYKGKGSATIFAYRCK